MILNDINIHLFHSINAFALKYPVLDQIVIFLANDLNTVFISFLVFLFITAMEGAPFNICKDSVYRTYIIIIM